MPSKQMHRETAIQGPLFNYLVSIGACDDQQRTKEYDTETECYIGGMLMNSAIGPFVRTPRMINVQAISSRGMSACSSLSSHKRHVGLMRV